MHLIIQSASSSAICNLHLNKYNQEFHYYPFTVKLEKCVGRCNTLNDSSDKVCIPNKSRFKPKCV